MNSGQESTFRGKLIESSGKEIYSADKQNISISVSMPFFRTCPAKSVNVDSNGIFQFKMPLLNNSVPYTMSIQA